MKTLKDNRIAMLAGPKIATLRTPSVNHERLVAAGFADGGDRTLRGRRLLAVRAKVWTRDGGLCHCPACIATGRLVHLRPSSWEMDHLTPLWAGGTDDMTNLAATHPACHANKTRDEAAIRARGDLPPTINWQRHPHLVALGIEDVPISC